MAHMQPQVVKAIWVEIESDNGTVFLPTDVLSSAEYESVEEWIEYEDDSDTGSIQFLKHYTLGGKIRSVSVRGGYGACLSAPGYSDCTEWSVFDTEQAAQEYLDETYGDEDSEPFDGAAGDGPILVPAPAPQPKAERPMKLRRDGRA